MDKLFIPPQAAFIKALPHPVLLVASNGFVHAINESATCLLQYTEQELLGRSWAGIDAHLTLIAWKANWKELRKAGFLRYSTDLAMSGALLRPVEVTMVPFDDNLALVLITDKIERTGKEALLSVLSIRTNTAHWRYDSLRKQWHISPLLMSFFEWGESEEELVLNDEDFEQRMTECLIPGSWSKLKEKFKSALREGSPFEEEILLKEGFKYARLAVSGISLSNALHTVQMVGTLNPPFSNQQELEGNKLAQFALDHARDLIYWLREDGRVVYANQSFLDRLDFTRNDLRNLTIDDFVVGNTAEAFQQFWDSQRNEKFATGEFKVVSKKGNEIIASYNTNFVKQDDEELMCVYLRDITHFKERNELLELTQFSTDNAPDLIFWTRPDGTFRYVNNKAAQRLEYEQEDFQTMEVTDIAPYFDEEAKRLFWERLRKENNFQEVFVLTNKNGELIETAVSVNYLNFAGEEIACSFCRDITMAKVRRRRRDLLEFTLDSTREMILWSRPDGVIQYSNEQFLKKTGYLAEEVNGNSIQSLFTVESFRQGDIWDELRECGEIRKEVVLLNKEGEEMVLDANFNYINYNGEEYKCIYFRDLSKKKKRDLALKLSYGALEAAAEVVVWLKETGEVEYLNQAMVDYIGGQKEDWLEQQLHRVFPQLKLSKIVPGTSIEYSMPSKDGHTVYLELTFSEIYQAGNRYFVIIGRNFTERYLRRKEIEKAQRRIEELSARLQEENIMLREEVSADYRVDNIVTVSPRYQKVLQQVSQVADADTTVLILGETGTGKELLARAVHELSEREDYPLIKVNCAALPENLIESELFGHEQGAFTGAHTRKKGRFELANKGTIFLDEVGELPLALQAKLLRVLQEGEFERVGGTETIKVDVRLIAATNRSLEEMVKEGRFRADLYYRLNVFPIVNIPLRERPEDIKVLTEYFVRRFATRLGKKIVKINVADLNSLQEYRFPGNVRELENIIERAVVLCQGETLRIPLDNQQGSDLFDTAFPTFDEMQRNYIIDALKRTEGRITGPAGAGRLLGLNDRTLMSKIRKFGIEKKEYLL
ncbi:sigma 54-interacting transcriptional regulator [Lewinella sp. LCG006]|uniref:sigma 54-interacting transcriptional regulator n=1 Tax=Lewinella sp. LCG006 TaxID=3231911 RepID=UPI0034602FF3